MTCPPLQIDSNGSVCFIFAGEKGGESKDGGDPWAKHNLNARAQAVAHQICLKKINDPSCFRHVYRVANKEDLEEKRKSCGLTYGGDFLWWFVLIGNNNNVASDDDDSDDAENVHFGFADVEDFYTNVGKGSNKWKHRIIVTADVSGRGDGEHTDICGAKKKPKKMNASPVTS